MRNLVINRILRFKDRCNGFRDIGRGVDWVGFEMNGVPYADVDLESLTDAELVEMLVEVVANFQYNEQPLRKQHEPDTAY